MATTLLAATAKNIPYLDRVVPSLPRISSNVDTVERAISLGLGGLLTTYALTSSRLRLLSLLSGGFLLYRGATGHCPITEALGSGDSDAASRNAEQAGTRVEQSIHISRSARDVYDFFRDFERLPRFMSHVQDVTTTANGRSHWVVRGPLGLNVEWDAEITADRPGELISWKSLPGADVDTTGTVYFRDVAPSRGSEIRVTLTYQPPAGKVGTAVAKLFGKEPKQQLEEDLTRLKQILETGGNASTPGQSKNRNR